MSTPRFKHQRTDMVARSAYESVTLRFTGEFDGKEAVAVVILFDEENGRWTKQVKDFFEGKVTS